MLHDDANFDGKSFNFNNVKPKLTLAQAKLVWAYNTCLEETYSDFKEESHKTQ